MKSDPRGTATSVPSAIGPVEQAERIEVIDVLRGFALFGVLLINMRNFDLPGETWTRVIDRIALWLTLALGESKFWTLFSFLFGLGFALQMQRTESRGAQSVPLYGRRLFVLLLFGLLHFLIYPGDILYDYAVTGFLLLLFRGRSDRTNLTLALICLLVPIGYHAVEVRLAEIRRSDPQAAEAVGAQDELGTLEPGKLADILLLDKNPLEDIKNTQTIWRVIKGGWLFDPERLRPLPSASTGK